MVWIVILISCGPDAVTRMIHASNIKSRNWKPLL